jgi:hypothetical protein
LNSQFAAAEIQPITARSLCWIKIAESDECRQISQDAHAGVGHEVVARTYYVDLAEA